MQIDKYKPLYKSIHINRSHSHNNEETKDKKRQNGKTFNFSSLLMTCLWHCELKWMSKQVRKYFVLLFSLFWLSNTNATATKCVLKKDVKEEYVPWDRAQSSVRKLGIKLNAKFKQRIRNTDYNNFLFHFMFSRFILWERK